MQDSNVQRQHRRGSSPVSSEIHQGFLDWISRLPSFEHYEPKNQTNAQRGSNRESDPLKLEEEARWQDDGGGSR